MAFESINGPWALGFGGVDVIMRLYLFCMSRMSPGRLVSTLPSAVGGLLSDVLEVTAGRFIRSHDGSRSVRQLIRVAGVLIHMFYGRYVVCMQPSLREVSL